MKAYVRKSEKAVIVDILGYIEYETFETLLDTLKHFQETYPERRIIFNFKGLNFVGSQGISNFVKALEILNKSPKKPLFCQVSPDFKRLFLAYEKSNKFDVFDSETEAIQNL